MIFRHEIRVRGSELDSFGHVNNAVYLNYLEDARWAFLEESGLLGPLSAGGLFLAVVEVRIRYLLESRLHDDLVVETELLRGSLFVPFRQEIFRKEGGKKVCSAWVRTIVLGPDRRPADFPAEARSRLEAAGNARFPD